MAANKLTSSKIEKLKKLAKETGKTVRFNDGERLYLCVEKNGNTFWEFRYIKPLNGKTTYMRIGEYPSTNLKKARNLKDIYGHNLQKGIDPQLIKNGGVLGNVISSKMKFSKFSELFFQKNPFNWKDATIKQKLNILNKHLIKSLGPVSIQDVSNALLHETLREISSKSVANKALLIIKDIMKHAALMEVPLNTLEFEHLQKYFKKPKTKHLAAVRPSEIKDIIRGFIESNTTPAVFCLFLWQLHLLLRPGEAAISEWAFADVKEKRITFPKLKSGKSHTIPLTLNAMKIASFMEQYKPHDKYIFRGKSQAGHVGKGSVGNAIRKLGFQGKMTSHGTRSVGSTMLNDEQVPSEVVEACLSHFDKNTIRSAYYRENFYTHRIPVMKCWSDFIDGELRSAVQELNGRDFPLLKIVNKIL